MGTSRLQAPDELDPGEELARRDELSERLQWLINLRWIALAGVFVAVTAAHFAEILERVWPLCGIASAMALLNLGFSTLHRVYRERTLRAVSAEALLQIAVDVIGLGLLVHYSGGLSNPFVLYFTFHVVIASILLDRSQAYVVAGLTTLVILFLALAEQIPGFEGRPLGGRLSAPEGTALAKLALVFVIGTTQVFSAYFVTTIVERLRARNREVRRLNADLADRVERLAAAEKKLQAEHARARAILECMDEGVVVVDLTGKVILANAAGLQNVVVTLDDTFQRAGVLVEKAESERMTAVSAGQLPAHPVAGHDHGHGQACLTDALTQGGKLDAAALALLGADPPKPVRPVKLKPPPAPARVELQRHGRHFENTVSGVHTDSGETLGLVVVSRDITDRTLLERQVLHAEKLHAVGNLAAGVAHELNTPLGTILGYAQMLLEDPRATHAGKELQAIEDQSRRCRRIVQSLLDFARKSGGGREKVQPGALLAKAAELTRHTLEMRGIALEFDAKAAAGQPEVAVSAQEIEQVLINLITNAADAIEGLGETERKLRGGGCVRLESSTASAGGVQLSVEDNGPGVPEHIRSEIFEPFFTTKAAGKGTGLGLSIARRVLEDHGGTLELVARADGLPGARFELVLPLAGKQLSGRLATAVAR